MKKITSFVLVATIVLCSIPTGVFATEENSMETTATVTTTEMDLPEGAKIIDVIDITPGMVDNNIIPITINSTTLVDNSWTFVHTHQGSNRSYPYNTIGFKVIITASNGSAVNDRISIELHDTVNSGVQYYTAYANGNWYVKNNISIVPNRNYYFFYRNLSSSTRNIKIHMVIYH